MLGSCHAFVPVVGAELPQGEAARKQYTYFSLLSSIKGHGRVKRMAHLQRVSFKVSLPFPRPIPLAPHHPIFP